MINDVRALRRPGALEAAAATALPVCLMHMQGSPDTMQLDPSYDDVTGGVCSFLRGRIEACREHGISDERIVLDPGFGFGKTVEHNFKLLAELSQVAAMGYPVLAGLSRKSMIAGVLDRSVEQRLPASIGLAVIAAMQGARLIRVHDVPETVDALAMIGAMNEAMTEAMTGAVRVGATEQLDQ
jgi:dihydropteroate synthase